MKFTPPFPPGGRGSLRKMLEGLDEDQKQLENHPIFREGYDKGYADALENHRQLTAALAATYRIDRFGE